jgi:hypothetical protein
MSTTLRFTDNGIVAHEQLAINDRDPAQSSVPPRLVRRAEVERVIKVLPDRLIVDTPSLWTKVASSGN